MITQVQAAYEAVEAEINVQYVNSTIAFFPTDTVALQRVRLPRESLADGAANCIDGTVLLASLLETMSLHPGIVVVPGHAFLGWEEWGGLNDWRFVETTMLGPHPFQAAAALDVWQIVFQRPTNRAGVRIPLPLRRWSARLPKNAYRMYPHGPPQANTNVRISLSISGRTSRKCLLGGPARTARETSNPRVGSSSPSGRAWAFRHTGTRSLLGNVAMIGFASGPDDR